MNKKINYSQGRENMEKEIDRRLKIKEAFDNIEKINKETEEKLKQLNDTKKS